MTSQNNIENKTEFVTSAPSEGAEVKELKHEATLYAEPIAHFGNFAITNALATSVATVIIIAIIAVALRMRLREVPKGIQNLFEAMLEGALSLADQVTNSRKISEKVFPLAFSIFLFILINNWLGLLPIGGLGLVEQG